MWMYLFGAWLVGVGLIAAAFRRDICALWNEPMLRHPVLIIESDDWGAGPLEQAEALQRLAQGLAAFRDSTGHPPVMTLALVLAVPAGAAIRASGEYRHRTLTDPLFAPIRQAIQTGVEKGVFALQLHGLEHYWPAALMASPEEGVRQWLTADAPQTTEELPSHLQSRWTNASVLPSQPLPEAAIRLAAQEEMSLFQRLFASPPTAAVPPTFIWNPTVEAAWATHGVEYVVAPGRRRACRDANGGPGCAAGRILNNERGQGVTYLVRDSYFEPMLGHTADAGLAALAAKTRAGRPCLLETHRANFMGDQQDTERAFDELVRLLQTAVTTYPRLRFISTEALGAALREKDPEWLEQRLGHRLAIVVRRLQEIPRLGRLTRVSGIAPMLSLVATLLGHREK